MPKKSFAKYCEQALDKVEDAHANGNLLYSAEYKQKNAITDPLARLLVEHGLTSHSSLLEQYPCNNGKKNNMMVFRLKAKVSASYALNKILTSGETVIDCGTGLLIAHIYACLLALEDKYGAVAGRARFDWLFGSEGHETPIVQRLVISNSTVLGGTKKYLRDPNGNILPLNPFAFLFDFSEIANEVDPSADAKLNVNYIQKCSIGSIVTVVGNSNYNSKHPSGIDCNFNSIYFGCDSMGEPNLRVFGKGKKCYTESDLKKKLVECYNMPQTEDDKYFLGLYKLYGIKQPSYSEKIAFEDVAGLMVGTNIDLKHEVWDLFINGSSNEVMHKLREFINIQLKLRAQSLPEDTVELAGSNENTYFFPESITEANEQLLFSIGAQRQETTLNFSAFKLESNVLDKKLRTILGLERKATGLSNAQAVNHLKLFFPAATVEKESQRFLITAPKTIYLNIDKFISNFDKIEKNVRRVQMKFRQ